MATGNQLQRQLAFADAAFPGNQHAHALYFQKNTMQGEGLGQYLGEVVVEHVHQVGAGLRRGKQRRLAEIGGIEQHLRHWLFVGDDDGGKFGGEQVADGLSQGNMIQAAQVVHFGAAEHLDPVGMD